MTCKSFQRKTEKTTTTTTSMLLTFKHNLSIIGLVIASSSSTLTASAQTRNFKKGISFHTSQSCGALEGHTTSSWWYSWGTKTGLTGSRGSFCADPDTAVANARSAGMEFVPMFWNSVPSALDAEEIANLQAANYLLTFNEPERPDQANMPAADAAAVWTEVLTIATQYNLEVVGPCMTQGAPGKAWYNDFVTECTTRYGAPCHTDYTCIHMYLQPEPCDANVNDWACIGTDGANAKNTINSWYSNYGNKPIWVTEYACAPWGSKDGTDLDCSVDKQNAIMDQLTPIFEESEKVFRYAWYTNYDGSWIHNSLNELVWSMEKGEQCPNMIWLSSFGTATWQIQTLDGCVAKADANAECHAPLSLSIDDDSCYCSIDSCDVTESTYASMKTYQEIGLRDSTALTSVGTRYNNFATDVTTTPVPTTAPPMTLSPTASPTAPSPTSSTTTPPPPSCSTIMEENTCNAATGCFWIGSKGNGSCGEEVICTEPGPLGKNSKCDTHNDCFSCECKGNGKCA